MYKHNKHKLFETTIFFYYKKNIIITKNKIKNEHNNH